MSTGHVVWVLVDSRIGNASQSIDLAKKIGKRYEVKNIRYNIFSILPSFFLNIFPIHIKRSILSELRKSTFPDVIISAGRRTALLALYLKRLSLGRIKLIQIMRPDTKPEQFDFIILPQHDNFSYTLPNIVRVVGALTDVNEKILQSQPDFDDKYHDLKRYIAVLIGGSTKRYNLTIDTVEMLSDWLVDVSQGHSLNLFITFSRRTPGSIKNYFKQRFPSPNIIYDPEPGAVENPYPALLGRAEYIITTSDSISMCSEAVSTGKPVYIFSATNFKLRRHNYFIQQLVDLGLAKRVEFSVRHLDKYNYEPLDEIKRVAKIINRKII